MMDADPRTGPVPQPSRGYLIAKRVMDVVICGVGLVLLSPLLALIALWVKMDSQGPVLFKQLRIGRHQKPFYCLKFRSMTVDAEARRRELEHLNEVDGPVFKIRDDPRVTRAGRILRKLSLAEFPQLWNVMTGEMSLVGTRPPFPAEVAKYVPWMLQRLEVTPGITCFWQISGRSNVTFDEWMRMDLDYIRQCSIMTDIKILVRTIPAVLFGKGAY